MPSVTNPMWLTLENATIRFRSSWARHTIAPYRIEITPARARSQYMSIAACGIIWTLNRISPYPPSFRRTPAKMTEPPVGASTWASGSHVCNGHVGSFVPKAMSSATNIRSPIVPAGIGVVAMMARMSNGHAVVLIPGDREGQRRQQRIQENEDHGELVRPHDVVDVEGRDPGGLFDREVRVVTGRRHRRERDHVRPQESHQQDRAQAEDDEGECECDGPGGAVRSREVREDRPDRRQQDDVRQDRELDQHLETSQPRGRSRRGTRGPPGRRTRPAPKGGGRANARAFRARPRRGCAASCTRNTRPSRRSRSAG